MSADMRIALLGYGEVGQILATDLRARGCRDLVAWDLKFADADGAPGRALESRTVRAASNAPEAVAGRNLVLCAVTAAQTVEAAQSVASALERGTHFVDFNSASPEMKKEAARIIETSAGRYVEAAVMAAVPPKRLATPMLLGGPHAENFLPVMRDLGFTAAKFFSPDWGRASAAKMCRSVMVKGVEALLAESLLTARRYGVEQSVLESLQDLFPDPEWRARARYMISRSLLHGRRRAEEMREVARTVEDAGIAPLMSAACAERQDWAAGHAEAARTETLEKMLDAIVEAKPDTAR